MITLPIKGHHPTLGLEMSTNETNRLVTDNIKEGAPPYRIRRLRTTIRGATIKRLNGTDLIDETHLKIIIENALH